jgi:hypothetical protein
VWFKAWVTDPDGDSVRIEVECRLTNQPFTGAQNFESSFAPSGTEASIEATGLARGDYHWRIRTRDASGAASIWISFGGNPDGATDFVVLPDRDHPNGDEELNDACFGSVATYRGAAWALILFGLAMLVVCLLFRTIWRSPAGYDASRSRTTRSRQKEPVSSKWRI